HYRAGDARPLYAITRTTAELSGGKPPRWRVPHTLLTPVAHASELWAKASGREPLLTVDGLRLSRHYMFFSSARAERELGYQARPAHQAISDALAWYRDKGYLAGASTHGRRVAAACNDTQRDTSARLVR